MASIVVNIWGNAQAVVHLYNAVKIGSPRYPVWADMEGIIKDHTVFKDSPPLNFKDGFKLCALMIGYRGFPVNPGQQQGGFPFQPGQQGGVPSNSNQQQGGVPVNQGPGTGSFDQGGILVQPGQQGGVPVNPGQQVLPYLEHPSQGGIPVTSEHSTGSFDQGGVPVQPGQQGQQGDIPVDPEHSTGNISIKLDQQGGSVDQGGVSVNPNQPSISGFDQTEPNIDGSGYFKGPLGGNFDSTNKPTTSGDVTNSQSGTQGSGSTEPQPQTGDQGQVPIKDPFGGSFSSGGIPAQQPATRPSFTISAPVPEHVISISAIIESNKFLNEHSYDPKSFHIWIKIGITKAREAYKNTADADRTDAMKVNCRIFKSLDAATEKNLDKIKDKETVGDSKEAAREASRPVYRQSYQGFGSVDRMKAEKVRLKRQRADDEAGANEIMLMDTGWRVIEKERMEREAKEKRMEVQSREVDRLGDEAWGHQRDQDRDLELDEDYLP
ncbi:hypothetical protein BKA61DRAFT_732208 [Leptodontidium sp. MPI-SDFR-AT-0119]|nr:hypothetical protein BKA61DRAFT_732208 [Leptodontidium sp. MPI-SDFR-AT-0119]